jgi:murein DD-endopeptidase MepM/ murein hydrolase activator NlpD
MSDQDNLRGEPTSQAAPEPAVQGGAGTPPTGNPIVDLPQSKKPFRSDLVINLGAWLVALSLVLLVGYLGWKAYSASAAASSSADEGGNSTLAAEGLPFPTRGPLPDVSLPPLQPDDQLFSVSRLTDFHTLIPTRPREDVITYTVEKGDSVFGIAKNFNLKPESVLWANYDLLKDNPDTLSPGMVLNIPPVDGILYQWADGDTVDGIASQFKTTSDAILGWVGNHIDLSNIQIKPGTLVMIPGGKRDFVQWVIPTIPRGKAGVSRALYGPGACEGSYTGAYGTGTFIWPTAAHVLSGNDYGPSHLGIDIAAGFGDHILAADSGVIVFAGWSTVGYGNMIMIDHGNGYQTVYGHLSSVAVHCGQSVYQGGYIGAAGSTGNSTGPHLHFEIRYEGGFINPWSMLP